MTFRSPSRNAFDAIWRDLDREKKSQGAEGVAARASLAILPAFIDFLEAERDRPGARRELLAHGALVVGSDLISEVLKISQQPATPEQLAEAAVVFLDRLRSQVLARLAGGDCIRGALIQNADTIARRVVGD